MTWTLTPAMLEALDVFARNHGRTWKYQLNERWADGACTGPHDHLLRQVRNQFGPNWLRRFRFDNVKTHSTHD